MKKLFTLFAIIALTIDVFAQSPQKMSYQCVVRNATGGLVTNHTIGMKISILQGSASGTVVYSETYSPAPQTNSNGLVIVEIGSGSPVTGTLAGINWAAGPYYLKTETDPSGGTSYTVTGTNQLLSVPYALYAQKAGLGDNWGSQSAITDPTIEGNGVSATPLKIAQQSASNGQVLKWDGITWKPGSDLDGNLNLPFAGTVNTSGAGISVTNSNTVELSSGVYGYSSSAINRTYGVSGRSASSSGVGVYGVTNSTFGTTYGVLGISFSNIGFGVFGQTSATTGKNYGVGGQTSSNEGTGVYGSALAATGNTNGVFGSSASASGYGVKGIATSQSGVSYGVFGSSYSPTGCGVFGHNTAVSGTGIGVGSWVYSSNGYSGYFEGGRFYVQGNIGIGITDPKALIHTYGTGTGQGNVLFVGEYKLSSPGAPPASGAGTRMMWYPDKAAFRAGYVDGPYWDAANIGLFSIAMGQSTIASGLTSTALGNATNASGENSTTIGFYTTAPSYCETVIGSNNTTYTPSSATTWNLNDRLFVIGNGTGGAARSNAMTVLKNGNIGIGVEIPGAKLDVAGQVKITGGAPGEGKVLTSDASGLASWQQGGLVLPYIARINSDNEAFSIINSTESGVNSVISANLTSTGNSVNTAITGTTSSSKGTGIEGRALATTGAAYGVKGRSESSAGIGVEGIAASTTGTTFGVRGYVASPTGYSGHFAGGYFYVEENVGIGNPSPTYKLDVSGNRIRLVGGTEWIAMRTDGSTGFVDLSYNGKISVQGTAATDDILLNPALASKVGIRTWVPMYDLDVTGNIRATGSVYYGGTAGSANGTAYNKPDYVFEESYQMLQTEEVEEFLNKENHLPWITSALKEKEENGEVVDMTRMAFETVESVENIQLQVIEQQKQIQNQQKQILNQQKEIDELKALVNTFIDN